MRKYGGLSFEDGEKFVACQINMEHRSKKDDVKGWHIIGGRAGYDASDLADQQSYELFHVNDDLCGLIAMFYHKYPDPKVKVLVPDGKMDDSGDWVWNKGNPMLKKRRPKGPQKVASTPASGNKAASKKYPGFERHEARSSSASGNGGRPPKPASTSGAAATAASGKGGKPPRPATARAASSRAPRQVTGTAAGGSTRATRGSPRETVKKRASASLPTQKSQNKRGRN